MDENSEKCLVLPNMDDAFACLKKASKEDTSECKPRFVLLTKPDCQPCADAKREYAGDITDKAIDVVDINTEEGKSILNINGLDYTPALVLVDCKNKIIEMRNSV